MFSAIFPIDETYVVFKTNSHVFNDIKGHCNMDVFEDKISYMKTTLQANHVNIDDIYTNEALILKYFIKFGNFDVFGRVSDDNCLIYIKTLGQKIILRSLALKRKSQYSRFGLQSAQ